MPNLYPHFEQLISAIKVRLSSYKGSTSVADEMWILFVSLHLPRGKSGSSLEQN